MSSAISCNFLNLLCCRDPDDPNPKAENYPPCKNRPPNDETWAPDGGWACDASKVDFPTVECLASDMRACGNIAGPSVFYSFGAKTPDIIPFRNGLIPRGVMFNDVLDDDYVKNVISRVEKFRLGDKTIGTSGLNANLTRADIYTYRLSEAFARVSTGTAYIVVLDYYGDRTANYVEGLRGAFQKPKSKIAPPNTPVNQQELLTPNTWRVFEFPTLQRNSAILQVVSVDLANATSIPLPYTQHVDWRPSDPGTLLPESYANEIPLPNPATKRSFKQRRDEAAACSSSSSVLDEGLSTTAPPAVGPSCEHQDQTPEIESEYCLCQGSITLPVLSAAPTALNDPRSSCAYTTIPASIPQITPTVKVPGRAPTTDTTRCQICTPYAINEDDCTSIPNCTPQLPSAYVQAGSSPVHVGTLTSTALSSSISSALESLCPSVTQTTEMTRCSEEAIKIPKIPYKNPGDGLLDHGELEIRVQASQYNATSLRNAMIRSAAMTAMTSATGKNCYTEHYNVEGPVKRHPIPLLPRWLNLDPRDHVSQTQESMDMCRAVSFAGVQYLPQYWRESPDPQNTTMYIDAAWEFQTPKDSTIGCDFIAELIDALAVLAPEFTLADAELGEAIAAACTLIMDKAGE
ncbi:MAG: hypothetical protein LQ352_003809 [Teloschistes flavicans]|nr:MAG: hypothetical protein LQ352_003809 [Teloschistes flavicans]